MHYLKATFSLEMNRVGEYEPLFMLYSDYKILKSMFRGFTLYFSFYIIFCK